MTEQGINKLALYLSYVYQRDIGLSAERLAPYFPNHYEDQYLKQQLTVKELSNVH